MEIVKDDQKMKPETEPITTMKVHFELEPANESAKKSHSYFQLEKWTGITSTVKTYLESVGIKGEVRAMIRPIIPTKEEYEPYIVVCVDRISIEESGVTGLAEEVHFQLEKAGFTDPEYKLWIVEESTPQDQDLVTAKEDSDRTSAPKVDAPRSVKHLTCWYWKSSETGCHKSAKDCLYAHEDTGRYAEQPRNLVPGGRAVAGRNASRLQAGLDKETSTQISVLDKTTNTDPVYGALGGPTILGGQSNVVPFPHGFVRAGVPNVQSLNLSYPPETLPNPPVQMEPAQGFNRGHGPHPMASYHNVEAPDNTLNPAMGGAAPQQTFPQNFAPGFQQNFHRGLPGLVGPPGFPQGPPPGYPEGFQQSIQQAFPNLPGLAEVVQQGLEQGRAGTLVPLHDGRLVPYTLVVSGNTGPFNGGLSGIPRFAPGSATNNVAFNGRVVGSQPDFNRNVAAFNNDRGNHLYMSTRAGQGISMNGDFAPNPAGTVYPGHRVSNQIINSGRIGHTRTRRHLSPGAAPLMIGFGGNATAFNRQLDGTNRSYHPMGRTVLDAGARGIDNARRSEIVVDDTQRGRSFMNTQAQGGVDDNNISTEFITSSTNVNNNDTSTTIIPSISFNDTLDPDLAFNPPLEDEGLIVEESTTSQSIPIMFDRRGKRPAPLNLNQTRVGMANLNISEDPGNTDKDKMTMQVYQQLIDAGMDPHTLIEDTSFSGDTSTFDTGDHNAIYATQSGRAHGGLNLGGNNTISSSESNLILGDLNTTYATQSGFNNGGSLIHGSNNLIPGHGSLYYPSDSYATSANRTTLGHPMVSIARNSPLTGSLLSRFGHYHGTSHIPSSGDRLNPGLNGAANDSLAHGSGLYGTPILNAGLTSIHNTAQSTPTRAPRFRLRGSHIRRSDHGTQASAPILYTNVNTLNAGRNLHEGLQETLKHLNGVEARLVNILDSARETFVSRGAAEYGQTIHEINRLRIDTKAAVAAAEASIAQAKEIITLDGDRAKIFGGNGNAGEEDQDEGTGEQDAASEGGVSIIV